MAISPKKALELSSSDISAVNDLENKIDNYLSQNYQGRKICYNAENLSTRVISEIISRYSNNWSVSYTSDQRDGAYLSFEDKGKTNFSKSNFKRSQTNFSDNSSEDTSSEDRRYNSGQFY